MAFLTFNSDRLNYNEVETGKSNNVKFAVKLIVDDFVSNECLCGIMKREVF